MSTSKHEFSFVINAVDRATSALTQVKRQLDSVNAPIERINKNYAHLTKTIGPLGQSLDSLGDRFEGLAKFTATRLALPTAAFGGYVLKQAADFEAATNKVKVLAGYAEDFTEQAKTDMKSLEELARTLGKELKFGPTDVMLGLGELLSNDPNVARAKASIKPVLNLSLASDMNPAESARLMNAMGSSFAGLSPTQSANLLARLQAISSVKLPEFSETISNVAGQAMLRGEDPTALLSASAVLSRSLIDKAKAGSHLEIFFKSLANSLAEKDKQEALKKMGLGREDIFSKGQNGEFRLRSLNELLPKFEKLMNNPNLSKVFGADAISSVLVLLKNYSLFLEFQKDLRGQLSKDDASGSAALQASVSSEGLKGSFEQLKGSIEEFSIALGKSGLLKEVTDIVRAATGLTDSLGKLDSGVLSALTNLGAMIIAMSGFLALAAPFMRVAQGLGIIGGAGAASGAASGAMSGTAGLLGLSSGALGAGAGALGVMGAASYLMTKDLNKGRPFSGSSVPPMSRQAFKEKMLAGAAEEKARLHERLISGEALSSEELQRAEYFASNLDARKIKGPEFTREAFKYGDLLRKTRQGEDLGKDDKARLDELRLYRKAGLDIKDLVGSKAIDGGVSINFKNVPPGTEIKKEGVNPAFDLKIEFARGAVMPKGSP